MRPEWNCVVDWTRSCRACSAPSPHQCPYGYLLDPEELAEIGRISVQRAALAAALPGSPADQGQEHTL